jgi:hypothetical protein
MLLAGDSTRLPWAARHSQRVEALIRLGQLVVLNDNAPEPERAAPALPLKDEAVPEPEDPEETDMPSAAPSVAVHGDNASGAARQPPKAVSRPKARKRRLSGAGGVVFSALGWRHALVGLGHRSVRRIAGRVTAVTAGVSY